MVFGQQLDLAVGYIERLTSDGIVRGLLGPREVPRVWDRHVLNCAVVASAPAANARVADVGSGAGLPGIVWAIARPDLNVTLVEPLLRRTVFLSEVVEELGLGERVGVWRGRAQDHAGHYDVVTARAVARLDKLATWCLPLVTQGGRLLAFKGASAERERDASMSTLRRLGATTARVTTYGETVLSAPTTVIEVDK